MLNLIITTMIYVLCSQVKFHVLHIVENVDYASSWKMETAFMLNWFMHQIINCDFFTVNIFGSCNYLPLIRTKFATWIKNLFPFSIIFSLRVRWFFPTKWMLEEGLLETLNLKLKITIGWGGARTWNLSQRSGFCY